MRQRADWIADDNSAVIENLLKLDSSFGAPVCGEICFATHIDGIKCSKRPWMVLRCVPKS